MFWVDGMHGIGLRWVWNVVEQSGQSGVMAPHGGCFFVLNTLQNTEMEGCLHKNNPLKIIKLVRAS